MEKHTDRCKAYRQINKHTNRQTNTLMNTQTDEQTYREMNKHTDEQTHKQMDKPLGPYILCPLMLIKSMFISLTFNGILPTA